MDGGMMPGSGHKREDTLVPSSEGRAPPSHVKNIQALHKLRGPYHDHPIRVHLNHLYYRGDHLHLNIDVGRARLSC